jgi:hypothetical protein
LPDRQIPDLPVEPDLQKYFASRATQIIPEARIVAHPTEERFAIVTDVGMFCATQNAQASSVCPVAADNWSN